MITEETRLESVIKTPTSRRERLILDALDGEELTARQIAYKLGFSDLNAVKPRLTELKAKGIVYTPGKAYDYLTERNVALWRRVDNGL